MSVFAGKRTLLKILVRPHKYKKIHLKSRILYLKGFFDVI